MRISLFFIAVFLPVATTLRDAPAEDKVPPPTSDAQQKALVLVKDVFGEQWDDAESDEQKQVLAKELLKTAAGSTEAANRYVLLRVARDVATQGGDGLTAYQAIDEMDKSFRVDAVRLKASVLYSLSQKARFRTDRKSIAEQSLALVTEAVAKDDFDTAGKLAELGLAAARKAGHSELIKRVVACKEEVAKTAEAYQQANAAAKALESNPTDPEANLALGEYRCFFQGDWTNGLPMLALGNDPELKSLAVAELGEAFDADASMKLGDGWWDEAEAAEEGPVKHSIIRRAGFWYARAKARGVAGLSKAKVERRLQEIAALGLPEITESVAANVPPRPTEPPPRSAEMTPQPTEPTPRPADKPAEVAGLWAPQDGAALGSDGYWKLEHKGQEKLVFTQRLHDPWELTFIFNPRVERGGLVVRLVLPGEGGELVTMTQAKFTSNLYLQTEGESTKVRKSHSHATQCGRSSRARFTVTNGEFSFYVNDRLNFEWKDPRVVPDVGVIIGGFKVKVRDMTFAPVN